MPSNEDNFLSEKIEVNLDNTSLIDYFEQQKQLELKEKESIQKEQEILTLENQEIEDKLLQDEIKFREDILKEIKLLNENTREMSLKNDEFKLKIHNEQLNLHNDFYVFLGIFISAFVVLIFSRSWFNNGL